MTSRKRILITPGEPSGVGPDITVQMAGLAWPVELVAIADPLLLQERAQLLNLPLEIEIADLSKPPESHRAYRLKVLPVNLRVPVTAQKLAADNAAYVLETLKLAADYAFAHPDTSAIVTGPVHKAIMNEAGIAFTGHTEFFRDHAKVEKTVMLFVVDQLRVALATTHLPLKDVSAAITEDLLMSVVNVLNRGLHRTFGLTAPRILVCGLNPHAGENGHLGREELDVIAPALKRLRQQGVNVVGLLPADTIFTPHVLSQADVVLAMYHDQALPLVKYLGFGNAVNVTLGLPYLRTSVDHGTALDVAGTTKADASSLRAALQVAVDYLTSV